MQVHTKEVDPADVQVVVKVSPYCPLNVPVQVNVCEGNVQEEIQPLLPNVPEQVNTLEGDAFDVQVVVKTLLVAGLFCILEQVKALKGGPTDGHEQLEIVASHETAEE